MPARFGRFGGFLFDSPRLLLTLVSLFWAGNIVLGRFIAGHIPPATISWIRWIGAFAIFLPFAWMYLRSDWKAIKANFGFLTLISAVGISLYTALAYYSLQFTEAINALLIASTGPLLVAMATYMLYGEKPTPRQVLGVLASLTGVVVVISRGSLETLLHLHFNRGDVWWFVGQIVYALYTALLRKRPAIHPFSFALVLFGWGGFLLTPLLVAEIAAGHYPVWDAPAFAALAYIMIFPSLIAYLFYNRGVEMIGPNRASPFYHLIPIFGSALAILFLGERPYLYHAAGYALVLTGIAIATASTKQPLRISAASPAAPAATPALSPAPPAARRRRSRSAR